MQVQIDRARAAGRGERVEQLEAEIESMPLPAALIPIWRMFRRLSSRRGSTGFGPAPISWADIEAFGRLSAQRVGPWDIEMIEILDGAYLEHVAALPARKGSRKADGTAD